MTMTYAQALDVAIAVLSQTDTNPVVDESNATVIEKLEALQAQLAKRTGGKKTPTKTQKENELIMYQILLTLEMIGEPVTVTELLEYGIEGYTLTNQKTSALLRKLIENGKVVKTIEGKKAKFALA